MIIGIYGLTNAGKSTLMNTLCGQQISIVDPAQGTTTDTVRKRIELLGYGPVTLIDTAGLDDPTPLAPKRLAATHETLEQIDLALFVSPSPNQLTPTESDFTAMLGDTPRIILDGRALPTRDEVIAQITATLPPEALELPPFFGDQLHTGQTAILVCPIDSQAPAGRLILPQVQALRAALDLGATAIVIQPAQLPQLIKNTRADLIVTDSQAFDVVTKIVADLAPHTPLTSFSILLSAQKADPEYYRAGLEALATLQKGDKVLILENCSHQVNCQDIGRVKIPQLLNAHVGGELDYTFVTGREGMPADLGAYRFAVQCGGCMTTRGHLMNRVRRLRAAGVPATNYGMLLRKLLSDN